MIGDWHTGTGRRKRAVARVFIKPGQGGIIVNDQPMDQYFSRETSLMIVRQPLELTEHAQTFDIKVNVHGGGETYTLRLLILKSMCTAAVRPDKPAQCVMASRKSEEHTSELQSPDHLVCRLLLE